MLLIKEEEKALRIHPNATVALETHLKWTWAITIFFTILKFWLLCISLILLCIKYTVFATELLDKVLLIHLFKIRKIQQNLKRTKFH